MGERDATRCQAIERRLQAGNHPGRMRDYFQAWLTPR